MITLEDLFCAHLDVLVQLLVPGQTQTSKSEHPVVPLPSFLPSIAGSGVVLGSF